MGIQWAREFFETNYILISQSYDNFVKNDNYIDEVMKMSQTSRDPILKQLKYCLLDHSFKSYEDCVRHSLDVMCEHFRNEILQLTSTFPKDYLTTSGTLFWASPKRFPEPLKLDLELNPDQLNFIKASAHIISEIFGLERPQNPAEFIVKFGKSYQVKDFKPSSSVKIATNDAELGLEQQGGLKGDSSDLANKLKLIKRSSLKSNSIEFEKDDDSNHHILLIASTSNLRAKNYSIKPETYSETKRIAGKIIPAIATTTSIVAGLVALELYKLGHLQDPELAEKNQRYNLEKFKNSFLNLSSPFATQSDPIECEKLWVQTNSGNKYHYTLWDKFIVNGEMTVSELLEYFEKTYDLTITGMSTGVQMLYCPIFSNYTKPEYLSQLISTIAEQKFKREFDLSKESGFMIDLIPNDPIEEEMQPGQRAEMPSVFYKFDPSHAKWSKKAPTAN